MITIFFVTSWLPASQLIKVATKGKCSHVALGFDCDGPRGIVTHQTFKGLKVNSFIDFRHCNKIVYQKSYDLGLLQEEAIFQNVLTRLGKAGYDFQAIFYLWGQLTKAALFNSIRPKKNAWQNPRAYLCTEILYCLKDIYPFETCLPEDIASVSPEELHGLLP